MKSILRFEKPNKSQSQIQNKLVSIMWLLVHFVKVKVFTNEFDLPMRAEVEDPPTMMFDVLSISIAVKSVFPEPSPKSNG